MGIAADTKSNIQSCLDGGRPASHRPCSHCASNFGQNTWRSCRVDGARVLASQRVNLGLLFIVFDSAVALAADDALAVPSFQICIVEKQGHQLFAFVASFCLGPSGDGTGGIVETGDDVSKIVVVVVHRVHFDSNGGVSGGSCASSGRRRACRSERELDCLGESRKHSAGTFDSEFSWSLI